MSFYVTTPIYYVNDVPHLGHFYTTIAADTLARFYRMCGIPVRFVTGTDEHGSKIAAAAKSKGCDPQQYVDKVSSSFREMVIYSNATPDDFIRTTEGRHREKAQWLWNTLVEKDQIYLSSYKGWYALRDEAYYDEKELVSTPEGVKAPTGAPVEWVEEPCYFFRLSQWQAPLLAYYERHPGGIGPQSRYNETLAFIRGGLRDFAISRTTVTWGIPVPGDPSHVMYVWIDALANYLTALETPEQFREFWPSALHLVGKDILRFHTVYWPALLLAAGLPPPHRVFAHGWWTVAGEKMSKSLGNVVDPKGMVEDYGSDVVRYFLLRHVPFGNDGDFRQDLFLGCIQKELSSGLGNLAQRTLGFIHRYLGGNAPVLNLETLSEVGKRIYFFGKDSLEKLQKHMKDQSLSQYIEELVGQIHVGNRWMEDLAPWKLREDPANHERMENGLALLLHVLRDLGVLLYPVMPIACSQLLFQVGAIPSCEDPYCLGYDYRYLGTPLLPNALPEPFHLFRRYEQEA